MRFTTPDQWVAHCQQQDAADPGAHDGGLDGGYDIVILAACARVCRAQEAGEEVFVFVVFADELGDLFGGVKVFL